MSWRDSDELVDDASWLDAVIMDANEFFEKAGNWLEGKGFWLDSDLESFDEEGFDEESFDDGEPDGVEASLDEPDYWDDDGDDDDW